MDFTAAAVLRRRRIKERLLTGREKRGVYLMVKRENRGGNNKENFISLGLNLYVIF